MTGSSRTTRNGAAKVPPPLDVHAHVDPAITVAAVRQLGAYVFAMTRSLDEFDAVKDRADPRLLWGVGVHPGRTDAVNAFTQSRFRTAIDRTPLVGEIGLDATSRVPMRQQVHALRGMFEVLQDTPRLVSVHSTGAHLHVIRALHLTPVDGIVLHWWTGSAELTDEAVRLGCSFSMPPAMMSSDLLDRIPQDRLLAETDHPDGDRRSRNPRKPGGVADVEQRVAERLQRSPMDMRQLFWENLRGLVTRLNLGAAFAPDWHEVLRVPTTAAAARLRPSQ